MAVFEKTWQNLSFAHFFYPAGFFLAMWLEHSAVALFMGMLFAAVCTNPYAHHSKALTPQLLGLAIVGLGASVDISLVLDAGAKGALYTVLGIAATFFCGALIKKYLSPEKDVALLITVGTAICGGSAIAAVSPIIRARHEDVSIALGTVFVLNACALLIFPLVGHYFLMSDAEFGLWSALAIHDTSSVMGATLAYSEEALAVGLCVKLARALYIVPVALIISYFSQGQKASLRLPWFIIGFVVMAIICMQPLIAEMLAPLAVVSRRVMVGALFLIGTSLTWATIKNVGARSFIFGLGLWMVVSTASLLLILNQII